MLVDVQVALYKLPMFGVYIAYKNVFCQYTPFKYTNYQTLYEGEIGWTAGSVCHLFSFPEKSGEGSGGK
jgi:hypothetical protein